MIFRKPATSKQAPNNTNDSQPESSSTSDENMDSENTVDDSNVDSTSSALSKSGNSNSTNNINILQPDSHNPDQLCSVCLEEYEDGDELICLPQCKHTFHKEYAPVCNNALRLLLLLLFLLCFGCRSTSCNDHGAIKDMP